MKAKRVAIVRGVAWSASAAAYARIYYYMRAALCDEENGFPYTAASEWRRAAELLDCDTVAADYAWRQWERIMKLPRLAARFASSQITSAPEDRSKARRHQHRFWASADAVLAARTVAPH